jgi:hypothetical protein
MSNEYTEQDLAEASGESTYRAPRTLELNEVSINGDADAIEVDGKLERKGGYFRKRILVGKPRDQKPEEVNLGTTIQLVFLKIRRKLVERANKGEIVCSTSEHNDKRDAVTLYVADGKQQVHGVAEDLRKQHPGLRTVQIVYALLLGHGDPELVRLIVKGSALGSEAKEENVMSFYQYISSFPKTDHMWEYVTELRPVVEHGAKTYFTIHFSRGNKIDERTLALAKETLMDVATNCREVDSARAAKIAQTVHVNAAPERAETESASDYPADDINPDDIPF